MGWLKTNLTIYTDNLENLTKIGEKTFISALAYTLED